INKAYDVLSDEEKREKYDRFGKEGVEGHAQRGQRRAASSFQDLFEQIFGGGFGGRGRREEKGGDLKIQATVTLEEAYKGVEKTYEVERLRECPECDGTGAENGNTSTCSECSGRGQVQEVQRTPFGRTKSVRECPECNGRGEVPEENCPACKGEGLVEKEEKITLDIPAGVRDGQRLRLRGKGNESRNGRSGDLYVFVTVEEHEKLERREKDLFTTVKVGVGDAALGTRVTVPTPDSEIEVEIPESTQPGEVLRVEGKGMPSRRGKGDLYIKVDVRIPEELDEGEREDIEQFSSEPEVEKSFFETVKDFIS
ncbi:MAG: DnaJ C-terminal domain-containing protein, partial [Candidatus Nanohaloarchaea archaeon]